MNNSDNQPSAKQSVEQPVVEQPVEQVLPPAADASTDTSADTSADPAAAKRSGLKVGIGPSAPASPLTTPMWRARRAVSPESVLGNVAGRDARAAREWAAGLWGGSAADYVVEEL